MAGSDAEERIRAKAEAFLRANYTDARIIHELVLDQGGCRIDLAAVGADYIAVVEIKSERDVLTRLPDQLVAAVKISNKITIVAAQKKAVAIAGMGQAHLDKQVVTRLRGDGEPCGWSYEDNPSYLKEVKRCFLMTEHPESGELIGYGNNYLYDRGWVINAKDLLAMLWADELRGVCFDLGMGAKATRTGCIKQACEMLSGREVRRRVCTQLRARPFPRADAAIQGPRAVQTEQEKQKAML